MKYTNLLPSQVKINIMSTISYLILNFEEKILMYILNRIMYFLYKKQKYIFFKILIIIHKLPNFIIIINGSALTRTLEFVVSCQKINHMSEFLRKKIMTAGP